MNKDAVEDAKRNAQLNSESRHSFHQPPSPRAQISPTSSSLPRRSKASSINSSANTTNSAWWPFSIHHERVFVRTALFSSRDATDTVVLLHGTRSQGNSNVALGRKHQSARLRRLQPTIGDTQSDRVRLRSIAPHERNTIVVCLLVSLVRDRARTKASRFSASPRPPSTCFHTRRTTSCSFSSSAE